MIKPNNTLFYICLRTVVYSIILASFLIDKKTCQLDIYSLMILVGFTACVCVFELICKKCLSEKCMLGYFLVLVALVVWMCFILQQAATVQTYWDRASLMESRLENIISKAPKPVVILDKEGKIKFVNGTMERYVGKHSGALIGTNISTLLDSSKFNTAYKGLNPGETQWIDVGNQIFVIKNFKGLPHLSRISILITRFDHKARTVLAGLDDIEIYLIITTESLYIDL